MYMTAIYGILLPFLGTVLGAGCVFFLKRSLGVQVQRALTGFAAGVMVAASIWSLLIPAMEQAADMGKGAVIPAAQFVVPALPYLLSFAAGAMLYVVVEELIPEISAGKHSNIGTVFFALGFSVMMVLDVVLG